jgi:hypothetical protein
MARQRTFEIRGQRAGEAALVAVAAITATTVAPVAPPTAFARWRCALEAAGPSRVVAVAAAAVG